MIAELKGVFVITVLWQLGIGIGHYTSEHPAVFVLVELFVFDDVKYGIELRFLFKTGTYGKFFQYLGYILLILSLVYLIGNGQVFPAHIIEHFFYASVRFARGYQGIQAAQSIEIKKGTLPWRIVGDRQ